MIGRESDNMPMFEFWLTTEDTDRLFSIKAAQGKNNLTGNDFAREMLEKELYRLHPGTVRYDENEEGINQGENLNGY